MLSIATAFRGNSTAGTSLQLLQRAAISQTTANGLRGASASLSLATDGTANNAISAIMQIIMDSKGNSSVTIDAPQGTAGVQTGDGDDTIAMNVNRAVGVYAGGGDDIIGIRTTALPEGFYDTAPWAAVDSVHGGAGNDAISIASHGRVDRTYGDEGNDRVAISGAADVFRINSGSGDDDIAIKAGGMVWAVDGGEGDDRIEITADSIHGVSGGKGDDHIVLNGSSETVSTLYFAQGDGHDLVETSGPLEIYRFSDDGTGKIGMASAVVSRNDDNTLTISFADSSDTITVKLTGDMAAADEIAFDYHEKGGALVIRQADNDAATTSHVKTFTRPESAIA
ncbi:MAG: hypothetical protein M9924_21700 [Rhizobiaceae bacterium]|nr:hypothetical protein [Rhizobiaceae bacterium]